MLMVYVAGPFSGKTREDVEANIRRAELLGLEVAKLGAAPWIPHANTSLPEFETVQPYQFWIDATLEQLKRCDAIILTEDWQRSSGARGEHKYAAEQGMPIFYSVADLERHLNPTKCVLCRKASAVEGTNGCAICNQFDLAG